MQRQFEALKLTLAAEGVVCTTLQEKLTALCKICRYYYVAYRCGIAGYLHILQRRDPSLHVVIYPTAVQGKRGNGRNCTDD